MFSELPSVPILSGGAIPPWGYLNFEFMDDIKDVKRPQDWKSTSALTPAERQTDFDRWTETTLRLIVEKLWPLYCRHKREWRGESTAIMHPLTLADLNLMIELQEPRKGVRRFDEVVVSPLRAAQWRLNSDLFQDEDNQGGSHVYEGFKFYDRSQDDKVLAAMSHICFRNDRNKNGNVNSIFKNHLQRPRPMQMALHHNLEAFQYRDSATASTPSMCGGHCLQALISIAALVERLLDDGITLTPDTLVAFGQWAVDIGDRRVMAGLHYPSDNICSWLLCLRLCDNVFHRCEPKKLMAHAILKQSYVFAEIERYIAEGNNVFQPALAEVKRLAHDVLRSCAVD